ncbi:MAG: adenylosuccinate lyase [Gemmatimonadetes bacterium]|nr:adenylosuccinate lyase [Gemmatimonadota bacterium]MYH20002.1 adenylosuccinate lyase [Gemmatimonadota bacterium]MYK99520.1 adenylosuccinate lyase [Gemmatimonadota bacterium]
MSLRSLSPLDGRYGDRLQGLSSYFSEWALIKYRLHVEIEWLITMAERPEIGHVRAFSEEETGFLRSLVLDFTDAQAERIKEIERETRHDVKAVEYYVREAIAGTSVEDVTESVHFCCTSEDINNLAYALMLRDGIQQEWLPGSQDLISVAAALAGETADIPMLSHTHGQSATPTTVGKELAVFVARWRRQLDQVFHSEYLGKFNGAVGNYNAHLVVYPDVPWEAVARHFVEDRLGLTFNPITIQIEPHDYLAELFHRLMRFNTVLLDFDRDMWSYISLGYFRQKVVGTETGSSVMPHKVNPIDFENSEANVGVSNALLEHLAGKLQISRQQRDLSDSSALRNVGVAIGHSLLAIHSAIQGMGRVDVDRDAVSADLDGAWEVLAEAVQMVMRKAGHENPYERMKALTRGQVITQEIMEDLIRDLDLSDDDKLRLLALTPPDYVGLAPVLARHIAREGEDIVPDGAASQQESPGADGESPGADEESPGADGEDA